MPGTADLIAAYEDLEAARPDYVRADEFYDGDVGEVYASERVKLLLQRAGAGEIEEFNYAHIPVDTVANRLEITSVTIAEDDVDQDDEEDGDGETGPPGDRAETAKDDAAQAPQRREPSETAKGVEEAQAVLDQLWEDNQLDAETSGLHLKVSRNGDCYLLVWPVTDDAGKVTTVDMRVNSAQTMRVIYDEEDPLRVALAIKSWTYDVVKPDGKKCQYTRATLYYADRVERWISLPDKKGKALCDPKNWEPYAGKGDEGDEGDGLPSVINHDYGRVPVFHFRNDRPYGKPEHLRAYGPQQLLNKLVMAQAANIDYESYPQRYALMDPTADQPMGNFLDPNHPEDDDDPEGEGNVSQLSADPGTVWRFWGAKGVGQFNPAGPDVFLKPFDRFVQAMAELTETPLYRFGSTFASTPSGAALRVADAPTVNKVENRQAAYDAVWEDAFGFALKLMGHDEAQVQVAWKPAEQVTDFEGWSVVVQKIDAGVPRRQALIETGYPADMVDEWLSGEAQNDSELMRKVELLSAIGDAVQRLGAGVAMGVLSEPQVQELVAQMLGGPEPPKALPAPPPSEE